MSTEKQAKASKTPTKWIYTGAGIPTVSKYPKIYEYLKNFEDGGKFLLLVGGEKEVQFAIIKYVLEEVMERLHPDNYHLLVEKEINCLDATNGELKLGLYDDVTKSKRKIIEILNGKYHPLKRKFYDIFGKGIKKKWGDRYYRKVLKFLVKASKKEDIIFNVNYKEISTQRILVTDFLDRGEECYIEERKKSTPLTWLINLFENLTKCEILSLFDISCENNEAWLGYASEIRRRNSSFKPNYIIGTLKKGEKVENIPPAFNNLFEKVNLDDKLKAEEKLQNQVEESKNKYIFRKDGERWYIQFEDEVIKPENSDGFEYIHYLVAFHYHKPITPMKLYQAIKGTKSVAKDIGSTEEIYSVNPKEIENAKLEELNKFESGSTGKTRTRNSGMSHLEKEEIKMNKDEINNVVSLWKSEKAKLKSKVKEFMEESHESKAKDLEKEIKDKQKTIDAITRQDHDPVHKKYYDKVSGRINAARDKIKKLSKKNDYKALLIWNHFEDSIGIRKTQYDYHPRNPIDWEI